MQTTETIRRSQRRRPELNINTSPPPSRTRDVVPETPPPRRPPVSSKTKGSIGTRALRVPTRDGADLETFLDSITPTMDMSNKENDRPEPPRPNYRDSHDLSLPPRQVTRDSLVANMLLSLDQFSLGQSAPPRPAYEDPYASFAPPEERAMTFNSRSGRSNGHGYTYSSDFEGADDSSRISSQPSRGRRSNSSSGFQSSLGRINSMRESTHRAVPGTGRALHSRSGKGSKSSSTNSIDPGYAQVLGSQRFSHGFGGRSSSFDLGHGSRTTGTGPSPWHIEFSNSFFNDEYDAAPTPTIPGGPRRLATVPSLPVLPPPEPMEPSSPVKGVERKRSTRSSKSATVGRRAEFTRDVPPVPAFDLDSAPAPLVGYEKSKEKNLAPAHGAPSPASHLAKEKPGFFRRMFGSSKTISSSPTALADPSRANSSAQMSSTSVETTASKQMKGTSAPPSRESNHSTTHVLQKKTSSFFRRRKQSNLDDAPPPVPVVPVVPVVQSAKYPITNPDAALALPPDLVPPMPEPSPITSLRRAMDPFLKNSNPPTPGIITPGSEVPPTNDLSVDPEEDDDDDDRRDAGRNVRGFSPDYEPSPKAVIRTVEPEAVPEEVLGTTSKENLRRTDIPSRQPPAPPPMAAVRTGSFLHDNSDSEEPSPDRKRAKEQRAPTKENKGKQASPGLAPSPSSDKLKSSPRSPDIRAELTPPADVANRDHLAPTKAQDASRHSQNSTLALPIEGARSDSAMSGRMETMYRPSSSVPSLKVDTSETSSVQAISGPVDSAKSIDEPECAPAGEPTEDDKQKAQKIYDGKEDFIPKEKAAAWMGEEGPVRQRTLRAYMELYDFGSQSVVASLRQVCARLILRAETQQVDRILVAFSKRWCDCNPNHGFKATDVIHTICYSIMLLNTDLHLADIEQKMTRSQFVKNTMTTIKQAVQDSAPDAFERPTILPGKGQTLTVEGDGRTSVDERHNSFRASFKPPPRAGSSLGMRDPDDADGCGPLVKAPFEGTLRAWEAQVEVVLKDIYQSIRDDRLPLYGAEPDSNLPTPGGLSVMNMLKRSPSVLSKAPSEGVSSTRGRINEAARATTSRWNSKSRSRPRGFGNGFSSSRTSFDDENSIWSPTESSATWSRQSLGRTHTSMSMDSFGSSYPRGDFQQSIGFANALSQAIIREDNPLTSPSVFSDDLKAHQLLDDESLELAGPPWVKEGIVIHKHHLDGLDKKAKDRNWTEVFAVVQKGQMSLFSFSANKSLRNKGRSRGAALPKGAVVGGGNWQENATSVGTFSLRQTLASALPPPGYSRTRPHVWALSLPTGAVHLFQVGTPEISKEFVNTANYWSARLSTHPLVGGISNIEYGWSEAIVNNALVSAINESTGNLPAQQRPGTGMSNRPRADSATAGGRASLQSRGSARSSSVDFPRPGSSSSGALGASSSAFYPPNSSRTGRGGNSLPGDRIHIADWSPPTQSLRPSNAAEPGQLATLLAYVRGIEDELQAHNALRSPMLLAFSPRSHNATRAMANWQRKSEYLLREIVKFRTYVDCLQAAKGRREEIYRERELARRLARGEEVGSLESEDEDDEEGTNGGQHAGDTEDVSDDENGQDEVDEDADVTLRPE